MPPALLDVQTYKRGSVTFHQLYDLVGGTGLWTALAADRLCRDACRELVA